MVRGKKLLSERSRKTGFGLERKNNIVVMETLVRGKDRIIVWDLEQEKYLRGENFWFEERVEYFF